MKAAQNWIEKQCGKSSPPPEIEYLGYLLTKEGIKPVQKKTKAVLDLQVPTILKKRRSFLGMVQFYSDMWKHHSYIVAPLTDLVGKGKKMIEAFDDTKEVMAKETILNYPKFGQPFEIHMPVIGNLAQQLPRMKKP